MNAPVPLNEIAVRSSAIGDEHAIRSFLGNMDRDGLYERHFAHGNAPNDALLARLEIVDGRRRAMFVALDEGGLVIGHAEYVASGNGAEFALMVLPGRRGAGVGRALLNAVLRGAQTAGIVRMEGFIQATNTGAIRLARACGFDIRAGEDRTTVIVSRPLQSAQGAHPVSIRPEPAMPTEVMRHDPDRVPLHRRPGPRTPLREGCRQVQCFPADALGGRQEA